MGTDPSAEAGWIINTLLDGNSAVSSKSPNAGFACGTRQFEIGVQKIVWTHEKPNCLIPLKKLLETPTLL